MNTEKKAIKGEVYKCLVGFRVRLNGQEAAQEFSTREEAEEFVYAAQAAVKFERYETLADGRVRVTCEFGQWTARDQRRAEGGVSQLRHTQYWSVVPQHDIRREQD